MQKKCKLLANFGIRYGDDTETIVDLGEIKLDQGTEQFPIYAIAQSLNSNVEQRDKFINNITVLYNQGISSYGTSNITLSELVNSIPIEGGWPNVEGLENQFNITYIDKNNYDRGFQREGKNIKVYKNGLSVLRGILITQGIIKKLGENYQFSQDFNTVFNKLRERNVTPSQFLESYINSPENYPYEIMVGDKPINVPQIIKDEIDKIVTLTELSKSGIEIQFEDNIKNIAKKLSPNTSVIDFIIEYLNNPNKFPKTIKYKNKELDVDFEINKEVSKITSKSLNFNTDFLNKLYALIKLRSRTEYLPITSLQRLFPDEELPTDEKTLKSKINKEISKDKEFPYRLDVGQYDTDLDSGQTVLSGFSIKSIYPEALGKILKLDYKGVYEGFELVDTESGYNIYKHEGRYYISRTVLTDYSKAYSEPLVSVHQAKLKIKELVNNDRLQTSVIINSSNSSDDIISIFRDLHGFVPKEGSIVKVMIADRIPGSTANHAYDLIEKWRYSDFLNYLIQQELQANTLGRSTDNLTKEDIQKIRNVVKNSYQAKEFLLCFHKIRGMKLDEILEHIKSMKYKYYMSVKSKSKSSILVEIDPKKKLWESTEASNYENYSIPKKELIDRVVEALNKKLEGTQFEIVQLTQQEIIDNFGEDGETLSTRNGFVTGNKIVINTTLADITTPIHEYVHVFLGMVKAIDYESYRRIVENCLRHWANTRDLKVSLERRLATLRTLYPKMSEYDIQEELFGDLYAEYIYRNKFEGFMTALSDKDFRRDISNLFELQENSISFNTIWGMPLTSLTRILSDCKIQAVDREKWFSNRFRMNRQAANWIRDNIRDGKIEENCE